MFVFLIVLVQLKEVVKDKQVLSST